MSVLEMRKTAKAVFAAGVAAADPYLAVKSALVERPVINPPDGGRIIVLALGKAAMRMAEAANEVLDDIAELIVITNYENAKNIDYAKVYAAGHPVPDDKGAQAAGDVITVLQKATENDQILALISGGGSALMPAPVQGIGLEDKAEVSRLLLGCGAEIGEMNLVRQQLSRTKGGGLLRISAPAKVRSLILSDVIGDDLRLIASGPTVGAVGSKEQAVTLLKSYGIWQNLPVCVQDYLSVPAAQLPPLPKAENQLVGSNPISLAAMKTAAPQAKLVETPLVGDVQDAAEIVANSGKGMTLFGGETTVQIKGDGLGGRNQELALRLAFLAEKQGWSAPWVFLSGGTDGRDGPCDAAGAIVDHNSLKRMRSAGVSPEKMLANNDSYHALKASEDLLMTGATGTNVADLQVLIRQ
jgi:hydroxypyruvate reductase